jgi:MSHA biogenesis protein MshN
MSLINRMLQDLDARRSDTGGASPYGEQIRVVPVNRGIHPAWWIALALAVVLTAIVAWLLLKPAPVSHPEARPRLPLKLELGLDAAKAPQVPVSPPAQALPAASDQAVAAISQPLAAAGSNAVAPTPGSGQLPPPPATAKSIPDVTAIPVDPKRMPSRAEAAPMTPPATAANALPNPSNSREAALVPDTKKVDAVITPPIAKAKARTDTPAVPSMLDKQVRELGPQQRAENEYRKALQAGQQGKTTEAIAGLEQALLLDPQHVGARQALIGTLLESRRADDAARKARDGLSLDPSQVGLAMILARLQTEKGELRAAIETLERTLPYGAERPDYQAFLAALLQRDQRHKQAIEHYLVALRASPQNGVWWMGVGISLQAENRPADAQEAFKRAKATNALTPELTAFVDGRLSQLQR